jgi:predicted amidophosphoribosyltransferase
MSDQGNRLCVFCRSRSGDEDACQRCLKRAHFSRGSLNHKGETAEEVVRRMARKRAEMLRGGGLR